jgi:hypothetical protein
LKDFGGLDFGFGLFSGIKNSITAIAVMELFIPRKERRTSKRRVQIFAFSLQKNKWKSHVFGEKKKNVWRREMTNATGEEVRVPPS